MEHGDTARHLVRMVGVMAICVAFAWAVQVLGVTGSYAFGRLLWIVGAAAIAGAGLIDGSACLLAADPLRMRAR